MRNPQPLFPTHRPSSRTRRPGRQATPPLVAALLFALLWTLPWTIALAPGAARAHPGKLDQYGGHFYEETGQYHYHKPDKGMALEKRKHLTWSEYPRKGIVTGRLERIDRPNALWLFVPYRPAYQELVGLVSPGNRDDRLQLLRVWLLYVSPEETGSQSSRVSKWFDGKVAYELKQKAGNQDLTVHFEMLGGDAGRMRAMVFLGEENINLWLVRNGWSFYVMGEGGNPYDDLFRNAEDEARKNKAGIWALNR